MIVFESSQAQIMYRTRYRAAVMVESFAISPLGSINIEYLPVRWKNSFLATRFGLGFIPGGNPTAISMVTNGGGASLPTSVTYNYLINNLRKGINRRVSLKCKSAPSKIASEWFAEIGAGATPVAYRSAESRFYSFGILGLRQQVVFDIPPHPRVVFLRANLTPSYVEGKYEIRGGISLGVSL
ncbi:hypothetical protein Emtol_0740 [Emticicia oligotrophica DSM 17448]|uniref:Uncharacterized protein n=1 Tax=Emticicia oligotrophica (strain DSM 17448 / CIP 109782 / MTCC 6937 / GPTSA100-15) TaxID=929562 RepID=A0ABN4AIL3_EMTOG|nr:hypothetical protein Emtol_0740 [Emticicia oligotrophica DSM 17448]